MKLLPLVTMVGVLAFSSAAMAAGPVKSCCASVCKGPMTVAQFATTVATVDRLEITLGQTAQTNAALPSVKKFGAYMVKSHTAISKDLAKVAAEQKVALPTMLDAKHQAIATKLAGLQGAAFDSAYIPAMVDGHTKVLAMLKSYSASCQDPAFKAFAIKITPIIAKHLAAAEKVQAQMKKDGLL